MDRNKKGQFYKGFTPWNKGKKLWYAGHTKKHSKKSRLLISKNRKGKGIGWHQTEETKRRIGEKNRIRYTGRKLSPEHRRNIWKAMQMLRGQNHPSWKGGKWIRHEYIYVPCPRKFKAMSKKDGYVLEHRLVMAQHIGKSLKQNEVVDHINRNTKDNRIENLRLYKSNGEHLADTLHKDSPQTALRNTINKR